MNAYTDACKTEAEGVTVLMEYIRSKYPLSLQLNRKDLQTYGDVVFDRDGSTQLIEIKIEAKTTGNFYFESWSNRSRSTLGWIHTIKSDLLFYYFLDTMILYILQVARLKNWLIYKGNLYLHKEVRQSKRDQMNDTWGHIISINDVKDGVGFQKVELSGSEYAINKTK